MTATAPTGDLSANAIAEIEKTVKMSDGIDEMDKKVTAAHEVFPWMLFNTVVTSGLVNDDKPEHASHKVLMRKFVLALSTPEHRYFKVYHKENDSSAYKDNVRRAADVILKFYRKYNSGDRTANVYRFLLSVSEDVVYRIIIDNTGDVPTFQSELIEA